MASAASRLIQALRSALSRIKPEPPKSFDQPSGLAATAMASNKEKAAAANSSSKPLAAEGASVTATATTTSINPPQPGKRGKGHDEPDPTPKSEPVVISFPPLDPLVVTTKESLAPDPSKIPPKRVDDPTTNTTVAATDTTSQSTNQTNVNPSKQIVTDDLQGIIAPNATETIAAEATLKASEAPDPLSPKESVEPILSPPTPDTTVGIKVDPIVETPQAPNSGHSTEFAEPVVLNSSSLNQSASSPPEVSQTAAFVIPTPNRIPQVIKPHIPLIKFRKGGLPGLAAPAATPISAATPPPAVEAVPAAAAAAAVNAAAGFKTTQMPVREWWDTPARFKRREVDLSECDLINGGGCDQLYQ